MSKFKKNNAQEKYVAGADPINNEVLIVKKTGAAFEYLQKETKKPFEQLCCEMSEYYNVKTTKEI